MSDLTDQEFLRLDACCSVPGCTTPGEEHVDVRGGGTLGMFCQTHLDETTLSMAAGALRNWQEGVDRAGSKAVADNLMRAAYGPGWESQKSPEQSQDSPPSRKKRA